MVPFDALLALLPPALLEKLAVRFKVDRQHEIRLAGPTAFVCLLRALLCHPEVTQRMLEEHYQAQTGGHADYSTFSRWFGRVRPSYFRALFEHLYEKLAARATQGERSALRLRLVDATLVSLSAKLLQFGLTNGKLRGSTRLRNVKT